MKFLPRLSVYSLWRYRDFVQSSISSEYRARFARSKFGTAWIVIQPLAMVLIYTGVLSGVLGAKLVGVNNKFGYAMYLLAGILGWSLFSDIIQRCMTVFVDNAGLIKKMSFPKITLPAISLGSAMVANLALMVVVVVAATALGFQVGPRLMLLVPLTLLTAMFAAALGIILGVLNVFMRDIAQIVPILLQFWFWVTPIIYPIETVPDGIRSLARLNPVTPIIEGYHSLLVYNEWPPQSLAWVFVVGVVLAVFAFSLYRRASRDMVDVL